MPASPAMAPTRSAGRMLSSLPTLIRSSVARPAASDRGTRPSSAGRAAAAGASRILSVGVVGHRHRRRGTSSMSNSCGQRFDSFAHSSSPPCAMRLAQAFPSRASSRRFCRSASVGRLPISIFCLVSALNVLQEPLLARFGQRDRHTLAADAAGAANAVHVDFGRRRQVEVDHVRHVIDVETARGDVGGHQDVGLLAPEQLHDAIALLLHHAAVQRLRAVAVRVQRVGELVDLDPRPAEHDRRLRRSRNRGCGRARRSSARARRCRRPGGRAAPCRRARFSCAICTLLRGSSGAARRCRQCAAQTSRQTAPSAGSPAFRRGSRRCLRRSPCRASRRLRRARALRPSLRSSVRPAQVIEHAARRADHDFGAAAQRADLVIHRRAAVDRHDVQVRALRVLVERLGHLHRQLARRHQHERARPGRGWSFAAGQRDRAAAARTRRSCRCRSRPGRACRCRRAGPEWLRVELVWVLRSRAR